MHRMQFRFVPDRRPPQKQSEAGDRAAAKWSDRSWDD